MTQVVKFKSKLSLNEALKVIDGYTRKRYSVEAQKDSKNVWQITAKKSISKK